MSALIDYIQIEIHKTYNKKYSKKYIEDKLIPIINYICSSKSKKFLFGGSQGIGKSSFINIISKTIEKFYNKKILLLSLDNYYLSRKQRLQLSKKIHQLLKTRGVPGTHDIEKLFVFLETSLAFLIALSLNVSPSSSTSNDSGWSNNLQLTPESNFLYSSILPLFLLAKYKFFILIFLPNL